MPTIPHRSLHRARRLAGLVLFLLPSGASAQYSVADLPIGWTEEGLLFFRGHVWVWDTSPYNDEAFTVSCPRSGLYRLGADNSVTEVWTGALVCPFIFYTDSDLNPDGRSLLVRHQLDEGDILGAISRVDLRERSVQTFARDEEARYESPIWIGDDRWVFLERLPYREGPGAAVLWVTETDPANADVLAEGPAVRGSFIEGYDRERGHIRLRRHSFPMYRSIHGIGARSFVAVVDTLGHVVGPEQEVSLRRSGWERRGDWVAYTLDLREPEDYGDRSRLPQDRGIAVRNLRTGEERLLFRTEGQNVYNMGHSPAHLFGAFKEGTPHEPLLWSPDGSRIVFPRSFEGGMTLWSIPLAGGEAIQLTFRDESQAPPRPRRPPMPMPRPTPADDPPIDLTPNEIAIMTEGVGYFAERAVAGQMVCLTFLQDRRTTRPAPSELVEAAEARWANVTTDDCPPTYGVFVPGDPKAPPLNNLDPQHLTVGRPLLAEDGRTLRLEARVRTGNGGTHYECSVASDLTPETVRCRMRSMWIS